MKPRIPILDKRFVYRNSNNTDVRATFERLRREQQHAQPNQPIPIRKPK